MTLSDLHFIRPLWLLALLLLPFIPFALRRLRARSNAWSRIVDAPLLVAQSEQQGGRNRSGPLAMACYGIAVLSLTGPAFREAPQTLEQREAPLAIALSLAPSMQAEDVKPSRLARARFKIADLLRERRDGQFALLAFADDAYTVAPVTDDGSTLLTLLDSLSVDIMPKAGNRTSSAIQRAVSLLRGAGFEGGDILLIADSTDGEGVTAAKKARASGFRISVIGVGTDSPGPVPIAGGGFMKDAGGNILLPKLDSAGLEAIADAGGGSYQTAQSNDSDLRAMGLLNAGLSTATRSDGDGSSNTGEERLMYVDDGPWLLLLLLPLAALGFRRGWIAVIGMLMLAPTPPAMAQDWGSLWQRDDQRAWQALQEGDAETAKQLVQEGDLAASASYKSGDYDAAAEGFSGDSADGLYNRGNALAQKGELQEALDAYQQALAIDPKMEDAAYNQQVVQQALQQQQEQKDQDGQDGDKDGQKQDGQKQDGSQEDGEKQEGDSSESGESSDDKEKQQGDPQESENQDGESTSGSDADKDQKESGEPSADAKPGEDDEEAEQAYQQAMEQALKSGEDQQQPEEHAALSEQERESREQQQAVEQWLRRIPDDPGGLLRRKFVIEHQRRQREGNGDSE